MDLMMRRRLMMQKIQGGGELPPLGQLWYWTEDGTLATLSFYADIVSHIYTDKGIITTNPSSQKMVLRWLNGIPKVTKIRMADGVTTIDQWGFWDCTSLESINLPESITSIGVGAFGGCTSLIIDTMYLPNLSGEVPRWLNDFGIGYSVRHITSLGKITSINDWAFYGISALEDVTLPNTIISVGNGAFGGCTSLVSVTCLATTPPAANGAFSGCPNLAHIYVPAASVEAYKAAWSAYASIISAIPE